MGLETPSPALPRRPEIDEKSQKTTLNPPTGGKDHYLEVGTPVVLAATVATSAVSR